MKLFIKNLQAKKKQPYHITIGIEENLYKFQDKELLALYINSLCGNAYLGGIGSESNHLVKFLIDFEESMHDDLCPPCVAQAFKQKLLKVVPIK